MRGFGEYMSLKFIRKWGPPAVWKRTPWMPITARSRQIQIMTFYSFTNAKIKGKYIIKINKNKIMYKKIKIKIWKSKSNKTKEKNKMENVVDGGILERKILSPSRCWIMVKMRKKSRILIYKYNLCARGAAETRVSRSPPAVPRHGGRTPRNTRAAPPDQRIATRPLPPSETSSPRQHRRRRRRSLRISGPRAPWRTRSPFHRTSGIHPPASWTRRRDPRTSGGAGVPGEHGDEEEEEFEVWEVAWRPSGGGF